MLASCLGHVVVRRNTEALIFARSGWGDPSSSGLLVQDLADRLDRSRRSPRLARSLQLHRLSGGPRSTPLDGWGLDGDTLSRLGHLSRRAPADIRGGACGGLGDGAEAFQRDRDAETRVLPQRLLQAGDDVPQEARRGAPWSCTAGPFRANPWQRASGKGAAHSVAGAHVRACGRTGGRRAGGSLAARGRGAQSPLGRLRRVRTVRGLRAAHRGVAHTSGPEQPLLSNVVRHRSGIQIRTPRASAEAQLVLMSLLEESLGGGFERNVLDISTGVGVAEARELLQSLGDRFREACAPLLGP